MAGGGGGAEQADAAGDDALEGLAGFGVMGEGGVLDALLDLVAFDLGAFFRRNRLVDVGGHGIVRKYIHTNLPLVTIRLWHKKSFVSAICYLGPEGTFSHILARQHFRKGAVLVASPTIEGVFDHVLEAEENIGLVPIENSSGGTVYDTADSLIRSAGRIYIREELALDIRIALLGHRGTPPTTVYSHFTQIKHHTPWLKERYPKAKMKAVTSTALAAQKAVASRNAAALASPGVAEIYPLEILEIPEAGGVANQTHFFVIGRTPLSKEPTARVKTALIAALPNVCGSLHTFLGPFARQKVSLSRIVSRPVPGKPRTYVFFIEIDGGPADAKVARALARAAKAAESMTVLGTYPARRRYKS